MTWVRRCLTNSALSRWSFFGMAMVAWLILVPGVRAHSGEAPSGLTPTVGIIVLGVGIVGIIGAVVAKRRAMVSPTVALGGVFLGIFVTAIGAILFEGLTPDPTFTAASMPFDRALYRPIALTLGLAIAVGGFVLSFFRWPDRPRYAFLALLLGLWISYPYLLPGPMSHIHPLGYVIVLATPALVGYILWRDAKDQLKSVLADPIARRFGMGVSGMLILFFLTVTGYLSFVLEAGVPHERTIVVMPAIYQLVTWPTLEVLLPSIPLFIAISPGQLLIITTLSVLVGLNAAVIARHWRFQERAGFAQGTAGSAAVVGTCTCGCCGPLAAKVALVATGPAIAAPIYWVFVDSASPLSALFIVGSMVLFLGTLLNSIGGVSVSGSFREIESRAH